MSTGYKITEKEGIYFLTFQIVAWVDIFSRKDYRDIAVESLIYCQENKGLEIFAYVIYLFKCTKLCRWRKYTWCNNNWFFTEDCTINNNATQAGAWAERGITSGLSIGIFWGYSELINMIQQTKANNLYKLEKKQEEIKIIYDKAGHMNYDLLNESEQAVVKSAGDIRNKDEDLFHAVKILEREYEDYRIKTEWSYMGSEKNAYHMFMNPIFKLNIPKKPSVDEIMNRADNRRQDYIESYEDHELPQDETKTD